MGADDEFFSQEERGWRDPGKWVCQHCVGDDGYLRQLVRANLSTVVCSYCGNPRRKAAPLSMLMDALMRAVKYSYNDEANAGCPYAKEMPIDHITSEYALQQVLYSQDIEWADALVCDVANAFINTGWVDAPDGEWMGAHHHERLHWSWSSFAQAVKKESQSDLHENNFVRRCEENLLGMHEMLPFLGQLVREQGLVRSLSQTTILYRIRPGLHPHTVKDLGAPQTKDATAGRMNPAGIPYLYLAFNEMTALAETQVSKGEDATVGEWSPVRDLQVIDLNHCLDCPSVFSEEKHDYEMVQFLYAFRYEISKPVAHDLREHLEYVPTQVVSEYFAQAFTLGSGEQVDGLIYRSAVVPGSRNLVIFPRHQGVAATQSSQLFEVMALKTARSGRVLFNGSSVA